MGLKSGINRYYGPPCEALWFFHLIIKRSLTFSGVSETPVRQAAAERSMNTVMFQRRGEERRGEMALSSERVEALIEPFRESLRAQGFEIYPFKCFPGQSVEVSYDYEMLPNRRPKFLAQTAAHVSGAAYYYQKSDVHCPPWGDKKMFGVCMHPKLGGWFAIRALLVFEDVRADLQQKDPPDCVRSQEDRIELLERFNFRWQDWSYRDMVPAEERYSDQQREYFRTPPGQRGALLRHWGYLTDTEKQSSTSKQG